jgi:polysaccharide deacetylase family protein (PEP-CTERM system associated)
VTATPLNAMTIDVEDYFQVSAFSDHIRRDSWSCIPSRIERNIEIILGLLQSNNIQATFFVLGWIAERYPEMVRRIINCGHELASHGYDHVRASCQTPEQFAFDIYHSKDILEQIGGQPILGYRAPSFSIGANNLWTFDTLLKAGYRYSSSIYPIQHDHYGMPIASRFAFYPCGQKCFLELPISTVRIGGRNFPAGGGGYFRLFPYTLSRWLLRRINYCDGHSGIFYFHPWELDPDQPRLLGLSVKTGFRHYVNLARMERKLHSLMRDFRWNRIDKIFL